MRIATIIAGCAVALTACSSGPKSRAEPVPVGHDCAGPTRAEADAHMATFGCPPCPCGASCPPCGSFGGKQPKLADEVDALEAVPEERSSSCPGFREPTAEEIEEHIATFGCAPCKCACVDGEVKCAPCRPCQPPPRLDGADAVGVE